MAKGTLILYFSPPMLISIPHTGPYPTSSVYVEGQIAFGPNGIQAIGNGVAIEVVPAMVGGKPGGTFRMSGNSLPRIEGLQAFGGTAQFNLPASRLLLVKALPGGQLQFFVGKNGGYGIQMQPVPIDNIKATVQVQ